MGAWPYSGFPWARLGMTQVGGPLAEVASWTSVTGLSLLIVILCASVVQWIRAGAIRFMLGLHPAVSVAVLLVVTPQFPTAPAGEFRVGWVQGNGPTGYFDDKVPGDVLAAQTAATVPLYGQPMDLLAWPEGGVDADPLSDPAAAKALDRVVRSAGAPLLMNAATTRGDDMFNTSLLWTADPAGRQWHDKVNPVPFGEYVPDRWFYELIVPDLVGLIQREYTPGSNPPLVQVGDESPGYQWNPDTLHFEAPPKTGTAMSELEKDDLGITSEDLDAGFGLGQAIDDDLAAGGGEGGGEGGEEE